MQLKMISPLLALFIAVLAWGCKKDNTDEVVPGTDDPTEILLKDTTYYHTLVQSYWTTSLPQPKSVKGAFDLRTFTTPFKSAEEVLDSLCSLTKYDRFSFIDRVGQVSGEIQEGVVTDNGLYLIFYGATTNTAYPTVRMVDRNSPAEIAGIHRGDIIRAINGRTDINYQAMQSDGFAFINAALFGGNTVELKIESPDGTSKEVSVSSSVYKADPLLKESVLSASVKQSGLTKKVGYIAYSSFISIYVPYTNVPNTYYTDLTNMVSRFEQEGIDELIVDLRYNGGGSVSTCEYFAGLLAPVLANGELMHTYKVNQNFVDAGFTEPGADFAPVNFSKRNSLNLSRIYFLVSSSTASASELLINSLRPYMDVQIISPNGENTYGKPVGFYPTEIWAGQQKPQAEIYVTSFSMYNAAGIGDYFDGLSSNAPNAEEDYLRDFGDPKEGLIAQALYHIENGTYTTASALYASSSKRRLSTNMTKKILNNSKKRTDMYLFRENHKNFLK